MHFAYLKDVVVSRRVYAADWYYAYYLGVMKCLCAVGRSSGYRYVYVVGGWAVLWAIVIFKVLLIYYNSIV